MLYNAPPPVKPDLAPLPPGTAPIEAVVQPAFLEKKLDAFLIAVNPQHESSYRTRSFARGAESAAEISNTRRRPSAMHAGQHPVQTL